MLKSGLAFKQEFLIGSCEWYCYRSFWL